MKLFISIIFLTQILFSQCELLPYDASEYYHYQNLDVNHVGSIIDCYYSNDWDILNELITLNNLSNVEVASLGYQNWDSNGRLKNFTLDYSSSSSPQYIYQKINRLPDNFGNLKMLESLEMYYHDLIVFPLTFPQLENLKALNMKGNRIKILNPNFGLLTNLEVLDLGYNDLLELPESISGLVNLNYFWIFGNDISYIPNSVCELDLDWSGESGDFIYFGSGGNHLCVDIPTCIESSEFFNIMLEEQGYAFQIESEQVCTCNDGLYPDCANQCADTENYGFIIDACGLCVSSEDACISDCTGSWGGTASLDGCGICDGDDTACEEVGKLSLDVDDLNNTYVIYETPENDNWSIGGFQFDVVGSSTITQSGGVASEMGFNVTVSGQLILGFSFTGAVIPPGMDTLLIINSEQAITGLSNITISDAISQPAQSLNFLYDGGNIETCSNGFDCLGECGGSASLDACGICNGIGTSTFYADNDGDGLGDSGNSETFCYEFEAYISNSADNDDSVFCPYQYLGDNFGCYGNCNVEIDCSGECGGNLEVDCYGECGGSGVTDVCGICDGGIDDILNCTVCPDSAPADCMGQCGGGAVLSGCDNLCNSISTFDECGVCDSNVSNDCFQDCTGLWGGESVIGGCDNICGSTLSEDSCGECGGDNTSCTGCKILSASNYCEDCTISCFESFLNDCCEYDLSSETMLFPMEFGIQNNYPNPFNPETTINYSIPKMAWISLSIYDIKGALVSTIIDGVVNPGNYSTIWNGNDFTNKAMPTGIYFSILRNNEILVSHKLLLMK